MRAAFVSLRGLLFIAVVLVAGIGIGVGGWWVWDTYLTSPEHTLEKLQKKFAKAEELYAKDPAAAEPLYRQLADQLQAFNPEDTLLSSQASALRAKVLLQLSAIAQAEDPTSDSARNYKRSALAAYKEVLLHDPDNVEAAGYFLQEYMRIDDLGGAELYAETVARYQPAAGEKMTAELFSRQGAAHFLLARRALRGPNPRPEVAQQHLHAIETLLAAEGHPKRDKFWRERALEVQVLKVRQEMVRQQADEDAASAKQALAAELKAKLAEGIAQAQHDSQTEASALTRLSPTNARGVLDFLTMAVELSSSKQEVTERANLQLAVCEQFMAAPSPRESVLRAVAAHLAQLPVAVDQPAVEQKVPALRLLAAEWAPIESRLRKALATADAAGAAMEPDAYVEMARKAHAERRWKDAEEIARAGLELARKHKLTADHAAVQQLHGEVAWALFAQNKMQGLDEHMAALRQQSGMARTANLLDGLLAIRDGRLDLGAKSLRAAQQDPRYARSTLPLMGLAHAYVGLGLAEPALAVLLKLENAYQNFDSLSEEERNLAVEFFPNTDSIALEALRCHLALNQVAPALGYKRQLEKRPLELAARLLVIHHHLAAGQAELAKDNLYDARDALEAARAELKAMPAEFANEPVVVWTEAVLTASQPAGRPSQAGPSNADKAEQMLKDYVAARKDFDSHLLWLCWLESRQRLDEANAVLADMEQRFSDRKKAIESLRAHLALARERAGDTGRLVSAISKGTFTPSPLVGEGGGVRQSTPPPSPTRGEGEDVLEVLYLTRQADPTLEGLLGKHESNMLSYLWNGQRSQHAGQLADAARAYSRALLSSRFQAEAQLGLLTSLLALADKDTPKTAVELLNDILRDHGMDPAALLAYAEVNRRLDNLQGHDSMEAALAYLERLLAPAQQNAVAADLLARGYYAAGRADLARAEAARALQLNASYAPALALAARLAFEDGEYETCQRYAEDLERALYGMRSAKPVLGPVSRPSPAAGPQSVVDRPQPTLMDGAYWRAVAADRLGHKEEARRIYQNLVTQHPNLAVGYLGLAGLSEQAKDLTGALHYAQQWRAQDAQDAAGAAAEVRLLAKAGKTDDAERVGKAYAEGNAAALVTVARAFAAAGAYDQAEAWARRAVQAARDKADVVAAHLAVGDACKARALSKMGDARRADVDKALAAYKQVWTLMPGQSAAGYAMAYLQATERSNESEAAYAVAQDARTGRYSQRLLGGDRLTLEQLDVLAAVYRASKHAGDSVTLFREALKRYPQEPMVHLHLGLAYRDQNMPRDAVATLTAAQTAALEKADAATDAAQKTHWQAVAEQAKAECEKLVAKSQ